MELHVSLSRTLEAEFGCDSGVSIRDLSVLRSLHLSDIVRGSLTSLFGIYLQGHWQAMLWVSLLFWLQTAAILGTAMVNRGKTTCAL